MKIIATHLLNDFSGSPKVLKQLLNGWVQEGLKVDLHTCGGREGFLSEIAGVNYYHFDYKWVANPFLRFARLFLSQLFLCFNILKFSNREDIIYVNTVLPFGAALAGKLKGNRVIYHIHETSINPAILKLFLFGMVKWCATDVVYVSEYIAKKESIDGKQQHILLNAIENTFLEKAQKTSKEFNGLNNILMVCSLKRYKGIDEFINLASALPNHNFRLVINAPGQEIADYFGVNYISDNVEIFSTQTDLHSFYHWADLVLNLSLIDQWVETFGLTLIEGMAYGCPAIAPPIGGVTEVVSENKNGFLISSKNIDEIAYKISVWSDDAEYFKLFQTEALKSIENFNEKTFIDKSIQILNKKNNNNGELG